MKKEQDGFFSALARACADGRSVSQVSPAAGVWCAVSGVCGSAAAAAMPASKVVKINAVIGRCFISFRFCTQVDWRPYPQLPHTGWKDN
jgi:hypothetical protein